jgi:PAS domain S-box-containing protein
MQAAHSWREGDIATLKAVVSRLWISLENARLIQNLREREERLAYQALVLENVHDAVVATDRELRVTSWNRGAEALYGLRADEAMGKKKPELVSSEITLEERLKELRKQSTGSGSSLEFVQYTRDGRRLWIDGRTIVLYGTDGEVIGYVTANRDITGRKQMEEALREAQAGLERRVNERTEELSLKNAALAKMNAQLLAEIAERKRIETELDEVRRRLDERVEAERTRMSRELHDGPVQDLFAVAFNVKGIEYDLENSDCASELLIERMGEARQAMVKVVDELREVCGELRPPTLVPLGLEKTIRSYTFDFAQEHPEIHVRLKLNADAQSLPENLRLTLFRILQQSLSNVVNHSQASEVAVRFQFDAEHVQLEVSDNGRGFEVPERWIDFVRQEHLGLVGMVERAEALGGELKVISAPGQGTTVRATIPRSGEVA